MFILLLILVSLGVYVHTVISMVNIPVHAAVHQFNSHIINSLTSPLLPGKVGGYNVTTAQLRYVYVRCNESVHVGGLVVSYLLLIFCLSLLLNIELHINTCSMHTHKHTNTHRLLYTHYYYYTHIILHTIIIIIITHIIIMHILCCA